MFGKVEQCDRHIWSVPKIAFVSQRVQTYKLMQVAHVEGQSAQAPVEASPNCLVGQVVEQLTV